MQKERRVAPEDAHGWKQIERTRFHDLWDALPSLTVLAALPGWGRTEWMRACRERLRSRGVESIWLSAADAAAALTATERPAGVVFVDDAVDGRHAPLWNAIAAAAEGARIVVSTIDTPTADLAPDLRVLDERDLRFTPDEISELIERNGVPLGTDTRDDLSIHLRGCPALVRRQLERLHVRRGERVWASLAFTFERSVLDPLLRPERSDDSTFLGLLRRGTAFRRFSVSLVADRGTASAADDEAQFERLAALPLGSADVCDETGDQDFVWSTAAWRAIDDLVDPAERVRQRERALRRTADAGRVTTGLLTLLELGRVAEADDLVFDQYRRFLLFTDGPTQERLLADGSAIAGHPSLQLLAGELRLRTRGANPQTVRDAARCLEAFAPPASATPFDRFRLQCRRAMAAAYAGRRATAVSHLERIADSLDATHGSPLRRDADTHRAVADRVAADLFLAFWAAVQTDRHDLALAFVRVMREYGDPSDAVTRIDRLTAMTEDDFAGLRSLAADGARPAPLEFSHAAALVLIEEGDDREALERTHPLAARVRPAPTRSAADALLLLSRALVAPEHLDRSLIEATVSLSADFWDDGRPSTFIAFAAVVGYLAVGRIDDARALIAGAREQDWFLRTAAALIALADGRESEATRTLERAPDTGIPRLDVVSGVVTAAALARSGLRAAAAARLDAVWHAQPSPRLLRFALRFLRADAFSALRTAADQSRTPGIAEVIAASADDRRPPGGPLVPTVSPVEREILALQRRGVGNADIAAIRGVSHNTIRTQIRLLYRKLGVTSRAEAVAVAERLSLLDDAAP